MASQPKPYKVVTNINAASSLVRSYSTEAAAIAAADAARLGAYILHYDRRTRTTAVIYRTGNAR